MKLFKNYILSKEQYDKIVLDKKNQNSSIAIIIIIIILIVLLSIIFVSMIIFNGLNKSFGLWYMAVLLVLSILYYTSYLYLPECNYCVYCLCSLFTLPIFPIFLLLNIVNDLIMKKLSINLVELSLSLLIAIISAISTPVVSYYLCNTALNNDFYNRAFSSAEQ